MSYANCLTDHYPAAAAKITFAGLNRAISNGALAVPAGSPADAPLVIEPCDERAAAIAAEAAREAAFEVFAQARETSRIVHRLRGFAGVGAPANPGSASGARA